MTTEKNFRAYPQGKGTSRAVYFDDLPTARAWACQAVQFDYGSVVVEKLEDGQWNTVETHNATIPAAPPEDH
jgi:hypothetical protein